MYNASVLHLGYGTEDACDVPSKMAAVLMLEGRNSSVEHLGPIFAVREQRRTGNTGKHDLTRKKKRRDTDPRTVSLPITLSLRSSNHALVFGLGSVSI